MQNMREVKGQEIANTEGQISRVTDYYYSVRSQAEQRRVYIVERKEDSEFWTCTCPDYTYRKVRCKHVFAVLVSIQLRRVVEVKKISPITQASECIYCKSADLAKDGLRHNKDGDIQKFQCRNCGKYFTINLGFEKMKHNPQAITSAIQLYFSGESLRHTQQSLRLLGVNVSHQTIYNWIAKYTALMNKYLEKITPQVSSTWRADEVYVKVKGNPKYLFALIDDETRFWIAQEVAESKYKHDARNIFRLAKERAGKIPDTIITDGLPAYHDAYKKEFFSHKTKGTRHIREIAIAGRIHNNKMERFNGELRDREKVMRSLKNVETPILKGLEIYHNYIRPHTALNGQTPSARCGLEVEGQNKWLTVIQNASIQANSE